MTNERASTGPRRRSGLTPTARRATISLSLAMRPKASSTPSRKAMGRVTARMLGRRFRKTRKIVVASALRDTRMASSRGIWSMSRMNVKTRRPRLVGGTISRTM